MKKNVIVIGDKEYDCNDLADREREKLKKRKLTAKKASKKRESTKNVQRIAKATDLVEESIQDRIDQGKDVGAKEVEGMIKRLEKTVSNLKELRKQAS